MSYTVIVDRVNSRVELYATGESFYHSPSNNDAVIKFARFWQDEDMYYVAGEECTYDLVCDELELSPEKFAKSKFDKRLFTKEEVTRVEWNQVFPFRHKVKREVYVLDTGWKMLEKTQQVSIQIAKAQMSLFDYSKNVEQESADDK